MDQPPRRLRTGARVRTVRSLFAVTTVLAAALLLHCSNDDEAMDATLLGPAASLTGNIYRFVGEVDNTLTTTCGSAGTPSSSSSTSGASSASSSSSSSSSGSSSSAATQTDFEINSFYQFKFGESLFLKYTYSTKEKSFRITPSTSTVSTCFTTDFVNCNGTEGNPSCETTDSVTCGGSSTFIFTSLVPALAFQAKSGTLRWDKGFQLNTDKNKVVLADLEFDMVGTDSISLFQGSVRCVSTN